MLVWCARQRQRSSDSFAKRPPPKRKLRRLVRQLVSGLPGPGAVAVALAPSRQDRRGELLYAEINQGLFILEGLTANVLDWWTPRQSLVSAVDAFSSELTEIPMPMPVPSAHPVADAAASEVVEAADPEAVGVPPKKCYT